MGLKTVHPRLKNSQFPSGELGVGVGPLISTMRLGPKPPNFDSSVLFFSAPVGIEGNASAASRLRQCPNLISQFWDGAPTSSISKFEAGKSEFARREKRSKIISNTVRKMLWYTSRLGGVYRIFTHRINNLEHQMSSKFCLDTLAVSTIRTFEKRRFRGF